MSLKVRKVRRPRTSSRRNYSARCGGWWEPGEVGSVEFVREVSEDLLGQGLVSEQPRHESVEHVLTGDPSDSELTGAFRAPHGESGVPLRRQIYCGATVERQWVGATRMTVPFVIIVCPPRTP